MNRPAFTDLPFPHLVEDSLEACDEQYRRILYHPWNNEQIFAGGMADDLVQFWSAVKKYKVWDKKPYHDLAGYALACLTTPAGNADAERFFHT